ncbi:hypothetical protein [Methanosphaera sp. WGK6]|uniref:hypothetical protein n=1 Tax=Methanosphaera sp. WGK6 TaxID=1561964 RepID=UPI00084BEF9F|nr:hypothetical protein [Methanosphaera sp. WGK6]OED30462.1 hypothetical protein NL43_02220 [Methanosphaera sp. WGK6]
MTFSEVILGSSPFLFAPQFGHRTRLYELDFQNQPENIAEILDKVYEMGVHEILLKQSNDLVKALDISESNGNEWNVIGMTDRTNFDDDLELFSKYNTSTVILDGIFVDESIKEDNYTIISNLLNEIRNNGYVPGIETRTPFNNLPLISNSDIIDDFDVLLFPLNFYGYMMDCNFLNNENKDKINILLKNMDKKIIANRTLATGILKPREAYDFIKDIDYLDAVCVGLAKVSEAEETLGIINEVKS